MDLKISHNLSDETIEAKVKWFRTLNLSERMDMLCAYTDLALELNPRLPDKKYAQQTKQPLIIKLTFYRRFRTKNLILIRLLILYSRVNR